MHIDAHAVDETSSRPTLKRKASAIDVDEAPPPKARNGSAKPVIEASFPSGSAKLSTSSSEDASKPRGKPFKSSTALEEAKPLAERVRPRTLDEFVGQEHLLGSGALLRGLIDADALSSLVLWGPPGTGKTTIARCIARTTKAAFRELSATDASIADLRKVFAEATNTLKLTGRKTILFIDEVQRFSKSQQDAFLPEIESGTLQCIFATTENPSFRLQGALLSRCRVFVLEKLGAEDCLAILKRALELWRAERDDSAVVDDELLRFLASAADGDARVALSSLELALVASSGKEVKREELMTGLRKAHLQYDRSGDAHYDTISALHKSVRGSDADAALYWLARMLEGGEDPLYVARRIVRMASEDVGEADPGALPFCVAAYEATKLIGMPECDCILAQCVVRLAEAPKSVRVYKAYGKAKALVRNEQAYPVPLHIRNAPTKLMKSLGYGRDYLYEPRYEHPVWQPFLPPELEGKCGFLAAAEADKVVDEKLLREWETHTGRQWGGQAREGRT